MKQRTDAQLIRTIPRAKSHFFRNLLLAHEEPEKDPLIPEGKYWVLAVRMPKPLSREQQLIIRDTFRLTCGKENVPAVTAIDNDTFLLLRENAAQEAERLLESCREEWGKIGLPVEQGALSEEHALSEMHDAYREIQGLFHMGKGIPTGTLLQHHLFWEKASAIQLFNLKKIGDAEDYGELLFGICCAFAKMELSSFAWKDKLDACLWASKTLYGAEPDVKFSQGKDWDLILWFSELVLAYNKTVCLQLEKNSRMKEIFQGIYHNIGNPDFNLHMFSTEGLYMNEDYLGKLFARSTGMKFSAYLQQKRIQLAVELLEYKPEVRIAQIAVMAGYAPDGQYFSKAFRKITGQPPKAYAADIQKRRWGE